VGCVCLSYGTSTDANMGAMDTLAIALIILGGLLGAVEVVRSGFQSLVGWGVVAIAIGLVILNL
jgi:hypothetical protein